MTAEQFHVVEVSPSYWRVTFHNGPVNLLDPDTLDQLGALVERIETDPHLTVVVFRSDTPRPPCATWRSPPSRTTATAASRTPPTPTHARW
jgi:enoyl-CoA hydratase/carnithine racemase